MAKKQYQIISGSHHDMGGNVTYKRGQVLEFDTAKIDPLKKWPGKFLLVTAAAAAANTTTAAAKDASPLGSYGDPAAQFGEDKTERFDDAIHNGMKVFKLGAVYNVFDESELDTPLNKDDDALSNIAAVETWLANYIAD